ncbi:hypothetical protein TNCT_499981 [Trichonephila clavata]|uniref:Uncharacterized protein n=1 Tax=Trichonephila clavata TaxID=2740835 RepID=A0A8X6G4F2_TRICU|nr:hypothetical protein TNCT_499981 [Trichonephila clavata]
MWTTLMNLFCGVVGLKTVATNKKQMPGRLFSNHQSNVIDRLGEQVDQSIIALKQSFEHCMPHMIRHYSFGMWPQESSGGKGGTKHKH